ncbi:MAG: sigma-54-dependent Fis family transcriptional regulator [Deltaproteobacteria bacterium]|nr:sigma-54-dependent Fis family transcriptional regulator [Deltaproteobacteria bacterium]
MKSVMVVDDEKDIRTSLEGVLMDEGFQVSLAQDGEEALKRLKRGGVDIVLLDIWMPGMEGLEVLEKIKERDCDLPVIMISGHGTIETAVKATKLGAYDFIEKPLSLDKVILIINHALNQRMLSEENRVLREEIAKDYEIIGTSRAIETLKGSIMRVAPTRSWVLITGENGTGKELVARNIHYFSSRSSKPFIEVNCAAIPEELIESELFGYEKGAFTGAVSSKKGKFDMADGGTILLDEIGDMSLKTQAKVLRILQEQRFERVGGTATIEVNVRVIAATNKDLTEEIKRGSFREDLYYRLNVIPFHIVPLRERRDDISLLVERYLKRFSMEIGGAEKSITGEALSCLVNYSWPGNVRELKNLLERLFIMSPKPEIAAEDLPPSIREKGGAVEPLPPIPSMGTLREARREFEREYILHKIEEHGGNISKTAEAIGIERSHLYRKMRGYGIEVGKE